MKIHGLQKMTLLDFPGKVACTVFLGGCDLRCPFCHNSELLDASAPAETDDAALLAFLEKRTGLLDGVVFTGGEPLLRAELPELLRRVRALGYAVKLDTNGTHPERLRRVVEAGLVDYVAMDVKNSPERYGETVGLANPPLDAIRESVSFLLSGAVDYEFRTTVVDELHREEDIRAVADWIRGAQRYYLQCFTDRDTVPFAGLHAPSEEKMRRLADIARPCAAVFAVRGMEGLN